MSSEYESFSFGSVGSSDHDEVDPFMYVPVDTNDSTSEGDSSDSDGRT